MRKNITLSAEESIIRRAREKAARQKKSLNDAFREWLAQYAGATEAGDGYEALMTRLRYARPGRTFSREEMNER